MLVHTAADLGALIRERRQRLDLDQKTLAERAGVSRFWIIDIESGKPRAEIGLVLRTLRALGLSVDVREKKTAIAKKGGTPSQSPMPKVDLDALLAELSSRKRG